MRYRMQSKMGLITSYVTAGGTATVGTITSTTAEHAHAMTAHPLFGHPLSEVAIVIGIIGTLSTMFFQALNYIRVRKMDEIKQDHYHNDHDAD